MTLGHGASYLLSSSAGAATFVVFGQQFGETERAIATLVVVFIALVAGDFWRRSTVSPDREKAEAKKSAMSIGALYIVALGVTNTMDADIYGAAMTAVAVGAGGPLVLSSVQEKAKQIVAVIFK